MTVMTPRQFDELWDERRPKKWETAVTNVFIYDDDIDRIPCKPSTWVASDQPDVDWEPFASDIVLIGGSNYRTITWRRQVPVR